METSMLKTLANKHKSTVTRMAAKYRSCVTTPSGVLTCFQAVVEREEGKKPLVAQFGGFAIRRRKDAILVDQRPPISYTKGSELLKRLQADACELCGSTIRVEVHHLRKMADLNRHKRKQVPTPLSSLQNCSRRRSRVCRRPIKIVPRLRPSATRNRSLTEPLRRSVSPWSRGCARAG